jgi:uncharacterized Zn-finger protein
MMDASGMMPYDSRTTSSGPIQRPPIAPQYMMGDTYTMAPIATNPAPHYQPHNHFSFNTYTPPSPPMPMAPSFRQYQDERPPMRVVPTEQQRVQNVSFPKEARSSFSEEACISPSIKSESQVASQRPFTPVQPVESKNITPNAAENAAQEVVFFTEVDTLMKAIQSKDSTKKSTDLGENHYPSPASSEAKMEDETRQSSPDDMSISEGQERKETQKRYICNIKDCRKRFAQKTHLDIHRRAHTGEKPYACQQPGCGKWFSQRGNLKTHERRHTGEKPFECQICRKSFAQRGNVRAHMETHSNVKRFHCKLDQCQKKFGQLGNLKSHMNKFHANTLQHWTTKFQHATVDDDMTPEEREMFEYFASLYKNSNKGIKGRGKDRKVSAITQTPGGIGVQNHFPVQHSSFHMHSSVQHLPHPVLAHSGGLGHYGMPQNAGHHIMAGRDPRDSYEMYDVDQDSVSGRGAGSSTAGTVYDEEHSRDLAFQDRYQERLF